MADPRICEYRHCNADLDEAGLRRHAKFCGPDHKAREHHLRKADPPGTTYPLQKPYKTVQSSRKRSNRKRSGTSFHVVGPEAQYVRAALRGAKRPQLTPEQRQRLLAKADRAAERLAA